MAESSLRLKRRVEALEKENARLKRSVLELSRRLALAVSTPLPSSAQNNGGAATSHTSQVWSNGEHGSSATHVRKRTGSNSGTFALMGLYQDVVSNETGGRGDGGAAAPSSDSANAPGNKFKFNGTVSAGSEKLYQQFQRSASPSFATSSDRRSTDRRTFYLNSEMRGHKGAVYCGRWSGSGRMLATGSFDKDIRVWMMHASSPEEGALCLSGHEQLISDVAWSSDSRYILSGSYDHTVKLWSLESQTLVQTHGVEGVVLCAAFSSDASGASYFCGTSKGTVHMFDQRAPASSPEPDGSGVVTWATPNGAAVNAIHIMKDVTYMLTGDSTGMIRTWDVRKASDSIEALTVQNEDANRPISCITASPQNSSIQGEDADGRLLAVNSYDNVLRVYDRGTSLQRTMRSAPSGIEKGARKREALHDPLSLVRAYKGHSNKNWPIRSSFFRGPDHSYTTSLRKRGDDGDVMDSDAPSVDESLLLATGSASTSVYLFDVWTRVGSMESGTKCATPPQGLLQKLRGHTGRVYSCDFHPSEPILASCSADSTVKIWMPKTSSQRREYDVGA